MFLSVTNNASLGAGDEVNDVFYLRIISYIALLYGCNGLRNVQSLLVDDAVGIVDGFYGLCAELLTAQANQVDAHVGKGIAA